MDEELNVLVWSARAADLWGLQPAEVEGLSLHSLDMGFPVSQIPLREFLAGKAEHQKLDVEALTRRGKTIRCEVSITPFLDGEGRRRGIVLLMEDVTERMHATTALSASDERFRAALLHSPIAVFMQDRDLRYTWAYHPFAGLPADALIGKGDAELFTIEEAGRLIQIKRRVLEQGTGAQEEIALTVDGRTHRYALTVEPLRSGTGAVVGVTTASMEIFPRSEAKQTP